ncbi:Omp28-related outer membrane protein [Taibaiella chishuiensis]|uniref:Outer membrane protein Omp28 n=1 Tax=Taibaiella chishuiensis TaxID=1434707 RepID=A0A2P8CZB4_9BACT|nr:Omp28-related outer membrane protein [Taibaiella chishuiensis]PSK90300.1 outer membrane protein Omp28 [Taibaiella chishuiensis]
MKRKISYMAILLIAGFASCKEHGVSIDGNDNLAEDTTYVSKTPEAPEPKNFLVEELSGVRCGNCPEAAAFMEDLNKQNQDRLKVVTIHVSHLARMITEREPKSIQNLAVPEGLRIVQRLFGEVGNMPCASGDRWMLGNSGNRYLVDGANNWPTLISSMKAKSNTTPVNIKLESKYNTEKDQYDITTTVHYTKAVTGANTLSIYLTESKIKDAFIDADELITYNHVLRKAITAAEGKVILDSHPTKEPGLTYIYRTALKIDASDPAQKFWQPENMKVLAFVSASAPPEDIHVYQVQEVNLK